MSQLERGVAPPATVGTWAILAAVLGRQLAAFWEQASGASVPRDLEHLRRQELLIRLAMAGGWRALPEEAIEVERDRHRFVDVALIREATREASVHEVWDLLVDVGEAMRGFDEKLVAMKRRMAAEAAGDGPDGAAGSGRPWRVSGLWIVRGTRRNRALIGELAAMFGSKFPGSAQAWLDAVGRPDQPMPDAPSLLWTDRPGTRPVPSRLERVDRRRPRASGRR